MKTAVPGHIEARIRKLRPAGVPVVTGSTPVVSFGDARRSRVATLGWNPSKHEFLDRNGALLEGKRRRLATLASIGEGDLTSASADAVRQVLDGCNGYFQRRPYGWFGRLERVLKHVGASYYDGSACHLDLVQWATDPVWRGLSGSDRKKLLNADLPFLRHQLSRRNIRLLLLNGRGILKAYEDLLGVKLVESDLRGSDRIKLFAGRCPGGLKVVGWNINLQGNHGVLNREIDAIGAGVAAALR